MKNTSLIFFFVVALSFCTAAQEKKPALETQNIYRPLYHFTPDSNWINDPNGLVYYDNAYHLFYQYNPFGIKWGHMSWGHAVSKDLFNWKTLPVALPEYKNAKGNIVSIFSGTMVVDSFNTAGFREKNAPLPLVGIYTSHIEKLTQDQSLAYSLDGIKFAQYSQNPILDIQSTEFRDPKVFWHYPSKKWVMIVSKPDEKKLRFYASKNLKNWEYLSAFGNVGNTDRVWECPDIFEMNIENTAEKKWVITNSAGHPQKDFFAMQYFIGDFDGTKFTLDAAHYPKYLDYGKDFYAGIIYNNLPAADNRKIMIAWANSWAYANDIPTTVFRGMMAVPRVLTLKKDLKNNYVLYQSPVSEISNYRDKMVYQKENFILENATQIVKNTESGALDISFSLVKVQAQKAGIQLFKSADEATWVYYDKTDNSIKLDRTKSGLTAFSSKFPSIESVRLPKLYKELKFRILVDKSIVEVFINDGEFVLTDQIFPTKSKTIIEFFSSNGKASFNQIKIHTMRKALH